MREILENEFNKIHEIILKMSGFVEENLELSIKSLKNQDMKLANIVIENDNIIDAYEEEIEDMCIEFIVTQNPVGSDFRKIITILKIITDLERIGDNSENIAKSVIKIGEEDFVKPIIDIPKMAKITKTMIYNSIDAYINEDIEIASTTIAMDDEVDYLYELISDDLAEMIEDKKEFKNQIVALLMIGRYLERIADHSTNICERVYYMVTGKRIKY